MKNNKLDLIKKAAGAAAHKRSNTTCRKEIKTEAISFKVGDTKDLLESFAGNNRSKAMRAALHYANEAGILDEYKEH